MPDGCGGGSLERAFELLGNWIGLTRLLPSEHRGQFPLDALQWLYLGIDIEEARDWAMMAGARAHEVPRWRAQGFTPFGASLWRQGGHGEDPVAARSLHVHLYGEDNGARPDAEGHRALQLAAPFDGQGEAEAPTGTIGRALPRPRLRTKGKTGLVPLSSDLGEQDWAHRRKEQRSGPVKAATASTAGCARAAALKLACWYEKDPVVVAAVMDLLERVRAG